MRKSIYINAFTRLASGSHMGPLGVVVSGREPIGRVFPGLQSPSRPVTERECAGEHRHVRAVALEGDVYTNSLRFEFLRFHPGGRNGRGSRTKTCALPG